MQASTQPQTTPTAPVAQAAPAAPQPQTPVSITTVGPGGQTQTLLIPKTEAEVQGLIKQRNELSDQLSNVTSRRRELSDEIRTAPEGASRTGLEDRLRVLDQRIVQLESDLASTGRQLALVPADLAASAQDGLMIHQPSGGGDDFDEGVMAGGFFSLAGVAVILGVRRWRGRKKRGKKEPALGNDSTQRLERLEQGMESIAIEIERVSEGQ